MYRNKTILFATLLLLNTSLTAAAGVIHKWVDEQGVTHYADEPPEVTTAPVTKIEVPEAERKAAGNDYYSIANQWQRLSQERLELERLRNARADREATPATAQPTVVVVKQNRNSAGKRIYHPHRPKPRAKSTPHHRSNKTPRNWLAQRQRNGFYAPRHKRLFY